MARAEDQDPLDEPAYAHPVGHNLAVEHVGYNGMRIRMNRMAEGLYLSNICWTLGPGPADQVPSCVDDPPTSGWGRCLVFPDAPGQPREVLCMWTFRSYRIVPGSHEWKSMHGSLYVETDAEKAEWLRDHLGRKWIELAKATERAGVPDFDAAARAMRLLGMEPPSEAEVAAAPGPKAVTRAVSQAPRPEPKTPKASAFKPVKADSRKGQVLKFFTDGGTSADAAMAQLGIQRNNLLSQLFLLRKDHGIEYRVAGDVVQLTVPEGQELFA